MIVSIRNFLYNADVLKSHEFPIPIISIGNITVGGTGKTPHIEFLVRDLKEKFKVAVLSRGYKRKSSGFVLATSESTVFQIGDEPKQIKQNFNDIEVAVCENRAKGIQKLSTEPSNVEVILLDDAFQHRSVKPGLSVLLIDYYRPMNEDNMLPYGSLRESQHEKLRANIIVISKCPKDIKPIERRIIEKNLSIFPYQSLYFSSINYGILHSVYNEKETLELEKGQYSILLVTGIANPYPLKEHLLSYTTNLIQMSYGDHHFFKRSDFEHIANKFNHIKDDKKIIITTEKDATRMRDLHFSDLIKNFPVYYIPIEIEFLNDDKKRFDNQIINYIDHNRLKHNKKLTSNKV